MNELKHQVLEMLLAGDHPLLEVLRAQLRVAAVARRDPTGVGFFTYLSVPAHARQPAPNYARLAIRDAEIEGLEHPAGFVLFVSDGIADCLECFIVYERWPDEARLRRAYYVRPVDPRSTALVETKARDVQWALGDAA